MKKIFCLIALSLVSVFLGGWTFKTHNLVIEEPDEEVAVEKADRPLWTLDDKWVVYSYDEKGKLGEPTYIGVREIWTTRYKLDWVEFDKDINFTSDSNFFFPGCQYMHYFHWPLMVGKRWKGEVKCQEKKEGPEVTVEYSIHVTTVQWLNMPEYTPGSGRKIKAFRLYLSLRSPQPWMMESNVKRDGMEYWYSPEVKIIVQAADFGKPKIRLFADRIYERKRRR